MIELTKTIGVVTCILLFIFSTFLLVRKRNKLSNVLLAIFLISNLLFILFYLLSISMPNSFNIWVAQLGFASGFLFGPTLFLFTACLTKFKKNIKSVDYLHFLPFVFFALVNTKMLSFNGLVDFVIHNVHVFSYLTICLWLLSAFSRKIKNYVSTIDKTNLTWLFYVIMGFVIMWSIDLLSHLLGIFHLIDSHIILNFQILSLSINLAFIIIIFYNALTLPDFLHDFLTTTSKYQNSHLDESIKQDILQKIKDYFISETPFLTGSLTINDVSKAIDVSSKSVSQVINELENKNFYDFTNFYRIEYAKQLINSKNDPGKTILEVLYESGFNSKSAFNNAFKKHAGCTPTEFKKANS